MLRLYFAATFPENHPECREGSLTDKALDFLKSVLRNDRASFQKLAGPVACRYRDVGSAITDAQYKAVDGQRATPPFQTGHIICIDGDDHNEWTGWLLGMKALNTRLVLAVSSSSAFTRLHALSKALEQRHIRVIRLGSLVNSKDVHDTLRYLTSKAS